MQKFEQFTNQKVSKSSEQIGLHMVPMGGLPQVGVLHHDQPMVGSVQGAILLVLACSEWPSISVSIIFSLH